MQDNNSCVSLRFSLPLWLLPGVFPSFFWSFPLCPLFKSYVTYSFYTYAVPQASLSLKACELSLTVFSLWHCWSRTFPENFFETLWIFASAPFISTALSMFLCCIPSCASLPEHYPIAILICFWSDDRLLVTFHLKTIGFVVWVWLVLVWLFVWVFFLPLTWQFVCVLGFWPGCLLLCPNIYACVCVFRCKNLELKWYNV